MVFSISEADMPHVPTRSALLVIDFQKGLIDDAGAVPTRNPPNLIQNVEALVKAFRQTGIIIWVNSQYEDYRPVNLGDDPQPSEDIVLDTQVDAAKMKQSGPRVAGSRRNNGFLIQSRARIVQQVNTSNDSDMLEAADDSLEAEDGPDLDGDSVEAFLTVESDSKSAQNIGNGRLPTLVDGLQKSSQPNDMYFTKSHYSAFRTEQLAEALRMHLITELFICGGLSNTSAFATAMDASAYGHQITLVSDCLGWRAKARYDHSLEVLEKATGCNIITCEQTLADIQKKLAQTTEKRPVRQQDREGLETMLGMLKLQSEASTRPKLEANDRKGELSTPKAQLPKGAGKLGLEDDSSAKTAGPPRTSDANGKVAPRVRRKIMQRRDFGEEEEAPVKTGTLKKKEKVVTPPSSRQSTKKESKDKEQTFPSVVEELPTKSKSSSLETRTQKIKDEVVNPPSSRQSTKREAKAQGQTSSSVSENVSAKSERAPIEEKAGKSEQAVDISAARLAKQEESSPWGPNPTTVIADQSSPASPSDPAEGMACRAEGKPLCEGDTIVVTDLLPPAEEQGIFQRLKDEVQWQRMSHQGGEVPRLVAVQGELGKDGEMPVYRHPADESPPLLAFSPTVSIIRREVEKAAGHAVNHCLIQLYRDGKDYISEHSDKTLDIVPGTYIANVSLGAERTMVFRGKRDPRDPDTSDSADVKPRNSERASLPHNSMMRMGLVTNMRWMHSIRQDKRMEREKTAAELSFGGCRISLTFRLIGTFLSRDQSRIWGQGAVAKHKAHARPVVNGSTPEAKKMIEAFGIENRVSEFDWPEVYGQGFDVLHMSNTRKLLFSGEKAIDDGVRAVLKHLELEWAPSSITAPIDADSEATEQTTIKLVDTDISRSTVQGHAALLLYLDAVHWKSDATRTPLEHAKFFTRLNLATSSASGTIRTKALDEWETYAAEDEYLAGCKLSVVDLAFFPILHGRMQTLVEDEEFPHLEAYYERMAEVDAIKSLLASYDGE